MTRFGQIIVSTQFLKKKAWNHGTIDHDFDWVVIAEIRGKFDGSKAHGGFVVCKYMGVKLLPERRA